MLIIYLSAIKLTSTRIQAKSNQISSLIVLCQKITVRSASQSVQRYNHKIKARTKDVILKKIKKTAKKMLVTCLFLSSTKVRDKEEAVT